MDPNPFLRNSFWTVGVGMLFNWVNYLGIHPGTVQRCVALPTYEKARKSLVYFGIGMSVILILSGSIGMIVYTKYKDCDPVTAQVIRTVSTDVFVAGKMHSNSFLPVYR